MCVRAYASNAKCQSAKTNLFMNESTRSSITLNSEVKLRQLNALLELYCYGVNNEDKTEEGVGSKTEKLFPKQKASQ